MQYRCGAICMESVRHSRPAKDAEFLHKRVRRMNDRQNLQVDDTAMKLQHARHRRLLRHPDRTGFYQSPTTRPKMHPPPQKSLSWKLVSYPIWEAGLPLKKHKILYLPAWLSLPR